MPIRWNSKLFDDKVGLDASYHWDGVKGGAAWRDKIRGYIIGCCPPIRPLLDWAEGRDCEPISVDQVEMIDRAFSPGDTGSSTEVVISFTRLDGSTDSTVYSVIATTAH